MVVVEEKKIGEVIIEEEGAIPTPTPAPIPIESMEEFVLEHEKLKGIIDRHGGCIDLTTLMTEGGVDEKRLELHRTLFADDDYIANIIKDAFCSRDTILEMKKRLEGDVK